MPGYSPAEDLLQGRVLLITGAGDGIGRVCALSCAEKGATVILLGRTPSKLAAVYDQIVARGLPTPSIAAVDLAGATGDDLAELADRLAKEYGRLDGLLHNAAILGERVPFAQYSAASWQEVMQVNFHAPVLLTRCLLPLLLAAEDGRLVFTSSGVGTRPRAYWGAYSVSKYALEGFAKLLADETENTSPLRVTVVNPGGTRTAMRAAAYPMEDPKTLKTPEALLPLYLYLLGPDSKGEHGKLFNPDWLEAN